MHPSTLKKFSALAAAGLLAMSAFAQDAAPPRPGEAPASSAAAAVTAASSPAAATPLAKLPYTPVLDVTAMDKNADPCVDFFQYTCGGWQKNNPIPPDQARWDVYAKMEQDNRRVLWGILDRLSTQTTGRTVPQQKIGDAFAACTNEALTQRLGAKPMKPALELIDGMKSKKDLPSVLAALQLNSGDDGLFFGFGSAQDYADSSRVIAFATQGGLGMPDRDYYLKTDAKSKELRDKYVLHVQHMFQLMGEPEADAKAHAATVMSMETALAKGSMTLVDQRDPRKLFHPANERKLQALTPTFDWKSYLVGMGLSGNDRYNVSQPKFFQTLDFQLRMRTLDEVKTYLRWHVAHVSAPFLSKPFVDENFDYYRKTLRGVTEVAPLWQRCVVLVDNQIGEALGEEFVKENFSPELKAKTLHMTQQIQVAMESEIKGLDWMGPQTKTKALEKLHGMVNKIGYPDKWRDYSALEIKRDDLLGNVQRGDAFEARRQLAKIGKPVDHSEWGMTPPTVNAYYDGQMNDINFPAGVLQPPLFDSRLDDAPNYGNTGGTIGHELTHGFDDEGRQFDAKGNLKNWWTKKDADEFEKRTTCLTDQYGQYIVVDDVHINSKLTLGEDLADFGGLVLALIAYKAETMAHPAPQSIDGFTPDQRFFIGMAQWACSNDRPEQLRLNAATNPHSPNRYRVNGLVANFKEFEKAFACKPGQPMAPVKRCQVW
jgi:endothelin-converting enzyme/putative endopeptidase